ncbi:hypothetical protein [Treponema denticola]|uniref:hypothetical protein n=1 Tax=Treponema denticola TaxID=158 RepID=UPI003D8A04BF
MNLKKLLNDFFRQVKKQSTVASVEKIYNENIELIKALYGDKFEDYLSDLEEAANLYITASKILLDNGSVLEKMDESQSAYQTNENVKKLLELIQQTKKELGLV